MLVFCISMFQGCNKVLCKTVIMNYIRSVCKGFLRQSINVVSGLRIPDFIYLSNCFSIIDMCVMMRLGSVVVRLKIYGTRRSFIDTCLHPKDVLKPTYVNYKISPKTISLLILCHLLSHISNLACKACENLTL